MADYTVIGHWTDNAQPWVWHITAGSAMEAASKAVNELCGEHEVDLDSFTVVEVFEGFHEGRLNNEACIRGDELEAVNANSETTFTPFTTAHIGTHGGTSFDVTSGVQRMQEDMQRREDHQTNRVGNRGIDF